MKSIDKLALDVQRQASGLYETLVEAHRQVQLAAATLGPRIEDLQEKLNQSEALVRSLTDKLSQVTEERNKLKGFIQAALKAQQDPRTLTLNELEISVLLANRCEALSLRTLGDLISLGRMPFLRKKGIGRKTLKEADHLLQSFGLVWS